MKAIQTLWTAPFRFPQSGREHAGFLSLPDFLATWSLSSHLLARHFPVVELYTDPCGQRFAVELQLPYTTIHPLPDLGACSPLVWNLPKLLTYEAQQEPFLHFDLDFLLWEPLSPTQCEAELLAQRPESRLDEQQFYSTALRALARLFPKLPQEWRLPPAEVSGTSINCGVFGGTALPFIHDYARSHVEILTHPAHLQALAQIPTIGALKPWHLVVTVEQIGLALALRNSGKSATLLAAEAIDECSQFSHLVAFRKRDRKLLETIWRRLADEGLSSVDRIPAVAQMFNPQIT